MSNYDSSEGKTKRRSVREVLPAVEIARGAKLKPIGKIAKQIELNPDHIEPYGPDKAKVRLEALESLRDRPDGKLIVIAGCTPTKAGEGKTVTAIGLAQALGKKKVSSVLALPQSSLGRTLCGRGGSAGGGYAQLAPFEDANLHLTGDSHAVASAHNLLAAVVEEHVNAGKTPKIDPTKVVWSRVVEIWDRTLRHCEVGLGGERNGYPHTTVFDDVSTSEIMAVLTLSTSLEDLKSRLAKIIVGYGPEGAPIRTADLGCQGALALMLKDAIKPNLLQTLEGTPALVHGAPDGSATHGASSLISIKMALKMGDYAIVETGYGAEMGAEKFFDITCRAGDLTPDLVVLVATCRALKIQGGAPEDHLHRKNLRGIEMGFANLKAHIKNLRKFGVPIVVAINRFPEDIPAELRLIEEMATGFKVPAVLSEVVAKGGRGGIKMAETVLDTIEEHPTKYRPLYDPQWDMDRKIDTLTREIYQTGELSYLDEAREGLARIEELGQGRLPICMAKTPYSFSDQPDLLGAPTGYRMTFQDVRVCAGAGYIVLRTFGTDYLHGMAPDSGISEMDILPDGEVKGLA